MSAAEAFVDSNVVLCLLSADVTRAERAEKLIAAGATISVQVLNETTSVARRKLGMSWAETNEFIDAVKAACRVEPLTVEAHDRGRRIAARHGLAVYDAMVVASALLAGCRILYSEDMQHGMVIDGSLRLRNPFRE